MVTTGTFPHHFSRPITALNHLLVYVTVQISAGTVCDANHRKGWFSTFWGCDSPKSYLNWGPQSNIWTRDPPPPTPSLISMWICMSWGATFDSALQTYYCDNGKFTSSQRPMLQSVVSLYLRSSIFIYFIYLFIFYNLCLFIVLVHRVLHSGALKVQ